MFKNLRILPEIKYALSHGRHTLTRHPPPVVIGGGAFFAETDAIIADGILFDDVVHGILQNSLTYDPGPLFLVGYTLEEAQVHYPNAQHLSLDGNVGKASFSPASAMAMLRVMLGAHELKNHLWDLVYLEQAGNEMTSPGPLAMIPDWAISQLQPETIASLLCGLQRNDATVGAALKSLMQHPAFSFSMIDAIQKGANERRLSNKETRILQDWQRHAEQVVSSLRSVIDAPPLPLKLLPSLHQALSKKPRVYVIPPDLALNVADVIDTLILGQQDKGKSHWLLSGRLLNTDNTDIQRSLERLGFSLWQSRERREAGGYGPSIWLDLPIDIENSLSSSQLTPKNYLNRLCQGVAQIIGDNDVLKAVLPSFFNDIDAVADHTAPHRRAGTALSAFRVADHALRHLALAESAGAAKESRLNRRTEGSAADDKRPEDAPY